ncbi:hypothetical protein PG984_005467 [Apiospora sp. TS-2023a]
MESGTDSRAGHTTPRHPFLILHPKMHEDPYTVAAYLGMDDVDMLARTVFVPRVVQITRLLHPLLENPNELESLDKVFQDFREEGSDYEFRAGQAESHADVSKLLYLCARGEEHGPNSEESGSDSEELGSDSEEHGPNSKPVALRSLLVLAFHLLRDDRSAPRTEFQGSQGLDMTSAELDGLVEDVYDVVDGIAEGGPEVTSKRKREEENPTESFEVAQAEVTRLIPESSWTTEGIRPKIRHYPEFDEHEFEKYCRIVVLVRYCAREMLQLAEASRALEADAPRQAGIMFPEGRSGTDNYKRFFFSNSYLAPSDLPIGEGHKPWWMREHSQSG